MIDNLTIYEVAIIIMGIVSLGSLSFLLYMMYLMKHTKNNHYFIDRNKK